MDKLTRQQRHYCMSRIRSKNTKPELIVRRFLFANGFRFRVNVRRLPGTPDIVLRKYHVAIFVNGCFWHGHDNCSLYVTPKSNVDFWTDKVTRNKQRDALSAQKLKTMGWHVIRIWECQLAPKKRQAYLESLVVTLNHLLLVNHGLRVRSYNEDDDNSQLSIAAEDSSAYNPLGSPNDDTTKADMANADMTIVDKANAEKTNADMTNTEKTNVDMTNAEKAIADMTKAGKAIADTTKAGKAIADMTKSDIDTSGDNK